LKTTEHNITAPCTHNCTACAEACPMNAISPDKCHTVTIRDGETYTVMTRDETRCMWARSLALCEEAGSGQLGWEIPKLEVPKTITDEIIEEALNSKDKIQTLCYQCPNFTDIIIERCLQTCPVGKKLK